MDSVGYAAGSALLTHEIVDWLKSNPKTTGFFTAGLVTLVVSFVINLVLAMGWAFAAGQTMSVAFARGVVQAVASSLFHEFTK